MVSTKRELELHVTSRGRTLRVTAAIAAVGLLLSACGIYVDRSAAIEGCYATRTFFDRVPNPRAGQEIPPLTSLGRSLTGPRYEPNFVRPTVQQLEDKIAYIRSRAASSRDRGLQQRADRLRLERGQDGGLLLIAGAPLAEYCDSNGY